MILEMNLFVLAGVFIIFVISISIVSFSRFQVGKELDRKNRQLEAALERAELANKAKAIFLSNMSHGIRTPMNAILGFTSLALENRDPDIQRKYLKNIDVSANQLMDLIDNILKLSKMENHEIVIDEELVDIRETCRKLCTIIAGDLKEKNQSLIVDMDIEHTYLYMDIVHYSQIFLNVIDNAIQYTADGGIIHIAFQEYRENMTDTCFIETVIEDNGIGMSDELLAHVYKMFSNGQPSTVEGIQGTGLGLVIAKNLIDLMKGSIFIESRQEEGTKITIRTPHRAGQHFETEQ